MLIGAGSAPMASVASAWDGLASELGSASSFFEAVTSGLVNGAWQGPAAASMSAAASPYAAWLSAAGAAAEQAAAQAQAVVSAYETARSMIVHPELIAGNRNSLVRLAVSNLFGQNWPAIAAAEAAYEEFWAQDIVAMLGYHGGASAAAAALTPFTKVPLGASAGAGGFVKAVVAELSGLAAGVNPGALKAGLGAINTRVTSLLGGINPAGVLRNLQQSTGGLANLRLHELGGIGTGGPTAAISSLLSGTNLSAKLNGLLTVNPAAATAAVTDAFGNTGTGNIGFGNTGDNNIGFGNTGNGNIGIGNSGFDLRGIMNSGVGNSGLFNTGSYNTGIGNSGVGNTGLFNPGSFNTGIGNRGSYNTGSFNEGSFNSGDFNAGDTNTGWFNTGNLNTGIGNSGDINTGIGNSGDMNFGMFVRGDAQGMTGFSGSIHIDQIPVDFGMRIPLSMTVSGGTFDITTRPFTIGAINLAPLSAVNNGSTIGPINVPTITISGPRLNFTVGGPGYTLFGGIFGTVGPIDIPFSLPGGVGFGNTSSTPSSGFFNSGSGGSSGFFNSGAGSSGWQNLGLGVSGVGNVGDLQSGMRNLGNSISGMFNVSSLDAAQAAVVSGVGNVGSEVSGFFHNAVSDFTSFSIGLGNQGGLNVGGGNIGELNFGF
ncbi:PPE domain-containing protein, partial [Mycobacterium asiaticum]|uniref:PPE domain-containing protein n=1 Tax=Mycobacterium asiaticum TaxID=1790 RepID=UPI003F5B0D62